MHKIITELFYLNQYPKIETVAGFRNKLLLVLKVYLTVFLVLIIIAFPILNGLDKLIVKVYHHSSLTLKSKQLFPNVFHKYGYIIGVLYISLLGPIFEEIIFRLGLSFKKHHILLAFCISFIYFFRGFVPLPNLSLRLGLVILESILAWGIIIKYTPKDEVKISYSWKVTFIVILISVFGLIHIVNYRPIDFSIFWVYPFFIIPQIFMGWSITYIRLKNGFIWGILYHFLINSFSTALYFIFHSN